MESRERDIEVKKELLSKIKGNLVRIRDEWENDISNEPKHSVRDSEDESRRYKCRIAWFQLVVGEVDNLIRYFWNHFDEGKKQKILEYKEKVTDVSSGGFWDSHEKMETRARLEPRVTPEDIIEGDQIINLMLGEIERIEKGL